MPKYTAFNTMKVNDFFVTTDIPEAEVSLSLLKHIGNQMIFRVSMRFEGSMTPSPVKVNWKLPISNILSVWSPLLGFSRFLAPNWRRTKCESKTAVGAPVLSLINHDGTNACTIAVSDPKTPIEIGAGISEEEAELCCNITFFTSYVNPIDTYEAELLMDFSSVPFTEAVKSVNVWWENVFGYRKSHVPKEAYLPMNSTWYSFHQNLNAQKLIEECEIAVHLGMKTLIIDDGWQTEDQQRGYQYCGDWDLCSSKIPDMKALINEIHRLGMKVMLWYSVPFVGIHSRAYTRFKNMALKEEKGVLILDIRYKEVRDYLADTYTGAVQSFGLDGLKLDFIDKFQLSSESPTVNKWMDIPSVEDALEALLMHVKTKLLGINPDILIEFRQRYIGPVVLKYGNMVRVGDCPHDSMRNRMGIIDLRLTSGNIAVHSDMLMWSRTASSEAIARQLISSLFGVPQVSTVLKELSQAQLATVRFWLAFYRKYSDVLHSDEISVKNQELGYTQVKTRKGRVVIGVNYANIPFEIDGVGYKYVLINSSDGTDLCIDFLKNMKTCNIEIYDCMGNITEQPTTGGFEGVVRLRVPTCGFVELMT